MTDDHPMINWLRYHSASIHMCRRGFMNTHAFAELSHSFNVDHGNGYLNIPTFILIEEIENEESNGCESSTIREYMLRLVKLAVPAHFNVQRSNYNDVLREYFDRRPILPRGMQNPLANSSFHSLSGEAKIWIISTLIQQFSVQQKLISIGTDEFGNGYYLTNEGRLYMKCGKFLENSQKDEGGEQILTLDIYLQRSSQWKLLAESEKMWKSIYLILETFDQDQIASAIANKLKDAVAMMRTEEQLQDERLTFEGVLRSFIPIPLSRTNLPQQQVHDVFAPPPPYDSAVNGSFRGPMEMNWRSRDHLARSTFRTEARGDTVEIERAANNRARSQSRRRIVESPDQLANQLNNVSMNERNGQQVPQPQMGPVHNNDPHVRARSQSRGRVADHSKGPFVQSPDRMKSPAAQDRARGANNVPDYTGFGGTGANLTAARHNYNPPNHFPVNNNNNTNQVPFARKKRCPDLPECTKNPCDLIHPTVHCLNFTTSNYCKFGRYCTYLHPPCKKDGECVNEFCVFTHVKQRHPMDMN